MYKDLIGELSNPAFGAYRGPGTHSLTTDIEGPLQYILLSPEKVLFCIPGSL